MNNHDLGSLLEVLNGGIQNTQEKTYINSNQRTALVVSCSMDQCQYDQLLWPVDPSSNTQSMTTLGGQTWNCHDGELSVNDTLTHIISKHDIETILVIGHTDCNVIADVYEWYFDLAEPSSEEIRSRMDPLVSLVGDAVNAGIVDSTTPSRTAQYRLVEYNVLRQVEFLNKRLSSKITVAGYVHDQDGVYYWLPEKLHLVTVDGETDPEKLEIRVPDYEFISIESLINKQ